MFPKHPAVLACALLAAALPHAFADEPLANFSANVGIQGPGGTSKVVYDEPESGSVTLTGAYGNYGKASGESDATRTPSSYAIRMSGRAKCDAGPTFRQKDFQGANGAAASALLSRSDSFTLAKATPYRISHMVGRHPGPRFSMGGVNTNLYITRTGAGGSPETVAHWLGLNNDSVAASGTLPAGTYSVSFSIAVSAGWVGSEFPGKFGMDEEAAEATARIDFGNVSTAAAKWRKTIADFSDIAVRLRSDVDDLEVRVHEENGLLSAAAENLPRPFDKTFDVTADAAGKRFSVRPRNGSGLKPFTMKMSGATNIYQDFHSLHYRLMEDAGEAVSGGHLPQVTQLYLEWDPPSAATPQRMLSQLSFYKRDSTGRKDEVAGWKTRYNEARDWFAENLPIMQRRTYTLHKRGGFIVSNIGLSAEEIIRQVKADKRLDSAERNMLIDSLNMADWAWRE